MGSGGPGSRPPPPGRRPAGPGPHRSDKTAQHRGFYSQVHTLWRSAPSRTPVPAQTLSPAVARPPQSLASLRPAAVGGGGGRAPAPLGFWVPVPLLSVAQRPESLTRQRRPQGAGVGLGGCPGKGSRTPGCWPRPLCLGCQERALDAAVLKGLSSDLTKKHSGFFSVSRAVTGRSRSAHSAGGRGGCSAWRWLHSLAGQVAHHGLRTPPPPPRGLCSSLAPLPFRHCCPRGSQGSLASSILR